MKLLIYEWNGYGYTEIKNVLQENGIVVDSIRYLMKDANYDAHFPAIFLPKLHNGNYDAVFSFDYFPDVARCCYQENVPYISWSYDSPLDIIHMEETLGLPTNYVFFFDRVQMQQYKNLGFDNVYHLPLAANIKRLSQIYPTQKDYNYYGADFSFVGRLYDDVFPDIWKELSPYMQGYLKSAISTQQKIYGCNFLDQLITDSIIERVNLEYTQGRQKKYYSKEQIIAVINRYITSQERQLLLAGLSSIGTTKLYSTDKRDKLHKVIQMGSVTYMDKMPIVFKTSKINLNISLKTIESGIPLRVMDILGSGGFLLSNFQPELAEFFVPDEEVILYSSIEEALDKASFYLSHDNLRRKIANRAFQKMEREFTFEHQFNKIFSLAHLI